MTESALDFVVEILSEYEEKVDYPALLSQIPVRHGFGSSQIRRERPVKPNHLSAVKNG